MAYRLFTEPRRSHITERGATFLATAQQQTLHTADGQAVHVYHWPGSGPHVLLAHGWESNSARWKKLVLRLQAARYAVTALDAPAHGNSGGTSFHVVRYAHCLAPVVEAYPIAYAIGHSAGGMALVYYLSQHSPATLQKLVLLATPDTLTDLIALYANMLSLQPRVIDAFNTLIEKQFSHPPDYYSVANFAQQLQLPGLIIHDRNDEVAPYHSAEAIHAAWPASRLLTTQGKGHNLFDKEIIEHVLHFLAEPNRL